MIYILTSTTTVQQCLYKAQDPAEVGTEKMNDR
jgi:hypothetical protein